MKKRIKVCLLVIAMAFSSVTPAIANIFDNKIFIDEVQNYYTGSPYTSETIQNLKFTDIDGHWAAEAIVKAGALNIVKGYGDTFRPDELVSVEETLAFVIRLAGLEDEAQTLGEEMEETYPELGTLRLWTLGYLTIAEEMGMITEDEYNQAILFDQSILTEDDFLRGAPVTRQQAMSWIIEMVNSLVGAPLVPNEQQSIFNYADWEEVDIRHLDNMEIALDNGLLTAIGGYIDPNATVTRAEFTELVSNLDSMYNDIMGLTKKFGTISGIKDEQVTQTGTASLQREVYIRTDEGEVDVFTYTLETGSTPVSEERDAVVFTMDTATGLAGLREGNRIEYLVDDSSKTIKFVAVKDQETTTAIVSGKLSSIDYEQNTLQIVDSKGKTFTYYMRDGLTGTDTNGDYIYIDKYKREASEVPYGSYYQLSLKNNVIFEVSYVGQAQLFKEVRGIVIENNVNFSFLTIRDNDGNEFTRNYLEGEIEVEKQPYYNGNDDIGYLDQVFPSFEVDLRDTTIDQIEAGDIVYITMKDDDPLYIERISASTNYTTKNAKIVQMWDNGDTTRIAIEEGDGQISLYDVPKSIFVSKSGVPCTLEELVAGDWVKLLINEAILSPGQVLESIKEITIEDTGYEIGELLRGTLGLINPIQKTLYLQDSYIMGKNGWQDYQQIRELSTDNNNIKYYYQGQEIPSEYATQYLLRTGGEVYIALESTFSGDAIERITFRDDRDSVLEADLITNVTGSGVITTASGLVVNTDAGTIVRKNNKLIPANSLVMNDYAQITLNGINTAAIIDITNRPVANSLDIARARIKEIEENQYFVVTSMSLLNGNDWDYTPIERKFVIDHNTVIIDDAGVHNMDNFLGYTTESRIDDVFTIVFEGDKATHLFENSYSLELVYGQVYETDGATVKIKSAEYLSEEKIWTSISDKDATMEINLANTTLVVKDDQVLSANAIQKGDKLRIFTVEIPEIESGMVIEATMIFIEN